MLNRPSIAGVYEYQIVWPPLDEGSPGSSVAPTFVSVLLPDPLTATAFANASFGGTYAHERTVFPAAPKPPSTRMWYVVPATTGTLTALADKFPSHVSLSSLDPISVSASTAVPV